MKTNSKVTVIKEDTQIVLEAGDVMIKEGNGRYTIIEADEDGEKKEDEKEDSAEDKKEDEKEMKDDEKKD